MQTGASNSPRVSANENVATLEKVLMSIQQPEYICMQCTYLLSMLWTCGFLVWFCYAIGPTSADSALLYSFLILLHWRRSRGRLPGRSCMTTTTGITTLAMTFTPASCTRKPIRTSAASRGWKYVDNVYFSWYHNTSQTTSPDSAVISRIEADWSVIRMHPYRPER